MRAVVLDGAGQPALAVVPEPTGPGERARVLACGLCGSDVEKLDDAPPGTVLGHEVVAELPGGRRVALVHHLPCGRCERCGRGHESTCEAFAAPTIVPGGFAEYVRTRASVALPDAIDDVTGTLVEPLACVLRGVERLPRGRVLIVGCGFIGSLFARVLDRRGDEVFGVDPRPERLLLSGLRPPEREVDAVVLCARGGGADAVRYVGGGGTILVFAPAGSLDLDSVYRTELHLVGSRSATPAHMEEAVVVLRDLELPPLDVLPLERFEEGLARYRSGRALKVVFTL